MLNKKALATLLAVLALSLLLVGPVLAQDDPPKGDDGVSAWDVPPAPTGGPDDFGYVWEEVPFVWLDISDVGTVAETVSNCDDCGEAVPLGFPFEFYGDTLTGVTISSNGYLTFRDADVSDFSSDCPIVSANSPDDVIAGFWDDLCPGCAGTVYYGHSGDPGSRMFVVQYDDVWHLRGEDKYVTFEIILFEGSNHILVQFLDVPDADCCDGPWASIGIEQVGSLTGLTYGCHVDDLAYPGLAILFGVPAPVPEEPEFVPEPGSVMLLASGLMGLAGYAGLRLRKK
jgi:hypothetical protein